MRIERNPRATFTGWNLAEATILTVVMIGFLATISIWTYQCSTSTGPYRSEYSGKIVGKRIAVFESEQGSMFASQLIVEEKGGRRFTVAVTEEIYKRAKPGMWIKKSASGIEFVPNLENIP